MATVQDIRKLNALLDMQADVESAQAERMKQERERRTQQ